MVGDPPLSSLEIGQSFDAVVLVCDTEQTTATLNLPWNGETARCNDLPCTHQAGSTLTLYNVQYKGMLGRAHFLQILSGTVIVERPDLQEYSFRVFKEVCAGIGGITVGGEFLGLQCLAVSDKCALACSALRLQSAPVIQGDLADPLVRQQIHLAQPAHRCLIAAGIPCQGYSRQGLMQGFQDPRSHTMCHVLQLAWHSQASGLVLECVTEIQQHQDATNCLRNFAGRVGFRVSEIVLELSHQWASKRLRWWAVLLPSNMPALSLPNWPQSRDVWNVGKVIPEWPTWHEDAEAELLWDSAEHAAYNNPEYGTEARTLAANMQAPTALHSWGNALRACPCGCRVAAFSPGGLKARGLRGIGVPSVPLKAQRFLHPREVALLNALPPCHPLPHDMRAALCLVGQLSSPLQALWILAHVRCWAAEAFASHALCPLQELCRYQEYLLQQRQDTWLTPSLQAGGTVQLQGEFAATRVQIPGPVKLCRLLQALKAGLAPGLLVRVSDGFRALPAHAFLHPQPFGPTYLVQTFVKRARLENDSASANQSVDLALAPELLSETLSVATPGASSATTTSQPQPSPVQASPRGDHLVLEAPSPSFATTLKDGTPPLTQQLEASSPASLAHSYVGPSPRVPASADLVREPSPSLPSGCTDLAVWYSLSAVMRMCPAFQALLLPPRVADVLLRLALSGQALYLLHWQRQHSFVMIMCCWHPLFTKGTGRFSPCAPMAAWFRLLSLMVSRGGMPRRPTPLLHHCASWVVAVLTRSWSVPSGRRVLLLIAGPSWLLTH